ncbi:UDP-xylose and UDP-N-acetylglucosamine transporter [Dirofilaria immitis]|nr:UDP-xylose and UDP-N-acetylglucosamine transporter [Dirofilaria immitis]
MAIGLAINNQSAWDYFALLYEVELDSSEAGIGDLDMMAALYPISGTLASCIGCMYFRTTEFDESDDFFDISFHIVERWLFANSNNILFVNVINNQALNFHVPVPLHIIFRSGSLLASLILTKILQRKQYSIRKYLAVLSITIGIIICTMATAHLEKTNQEKTLDDVEKYHREWLIGIAMLTIALVASAYLAICQETMYEVYGKHTEEAMFVIHGTSLPFFAFMGEDIYKSAVAFSRSYLIDILGFLIPHMWVYLAATCLLQLMCISFIYRLNATFESLTVTMVVTIRKFLSLLISILWFRNPFTLAHWIGAALVFAGTLAFADIWTNRVNLAKENKKEKNID